VWPDRQLDPLRAEIDEVEVIPLIAERLHGVGQIGRIHETRNPEPDRVARA
jgi:chorismate mutase